MHALDILFIVAALFFIIVGVQRGLIGEVFRLVGLVTGFFIAYLYYPEAGRLIGIFPPAIARAAGFTAVFLATMLAVISIGWLLKKAVHLTPLGWIDRLCGGAIGLCKVVIIFWVVCLSFSSFPAAVSRLHVNRSLVFRTCGKLPPALTLGGLSRIRSIFRKSVDGDLPRKLKNTQAAMERINDKADSIRNRFLKYR